MLVEIARFGRWRASSQLPIEEGAEPQAGGIEVWLDRVHPADLEALKQGLDAHLEGQTAHFESEHRLKHGDQSYRPPMRHSQ